MTVSQRALDLVAFLEKDTCNVRHSMHQRNVTVSQRALYLVAFLEKDTCNVRHSMRHPVAYYLPSIQSYVFEY